MSDSAKAPLTGYLFQFEKALLLLSSLENTDDYISIEDVDDIASHKENGTVIFSIQAKHSISKTGTTFEDTSYSLWRTLQIWINKLEAKIFNNTTTFVCSTNKAIPNDSLLHLIQTDIFDNVVLKIEEILKDQKQKLAKKIIKFPIGGKSILETINLVEFVLSKKDTFKIIQANIKIEDEENVKEKFFNKLHLNSEKYSDTIRNNIFISYYGWISYSSSAIWKQSLEAKFSKKLFDEQWANIISNSAIVNNVFRTDLGLELEAIKIILAKKKAKIKELELKFDREASLSKITNSIQEYLKILPIEDRDSKRVLLDPETSASIKVEDIKSNNITFLSRIGSGANHMCYHLATLLGLHEYFLKLADADKKNYVPSFLVLDQPSHVYFPEDYNILTDKVTKKENVSEDIENTRLIFNACSKFMERTGFRTQIIILEHAPPSTWKDIEHINLVSEWRGDISDATTKYDALIQKEWIEFN